MLAACLTWAVWAAWAAWACNCPPLWTGFDPVQCLDEKPRRLRNLRGFSLADAAEKNAGIAQVNQVISQMKQGARQNAGWDEEAFAAAVQSLRHHRGGLVVNGGAVSRFPI